MVTSWIYSICTECFFDFRDNEEEKCSGSTPGRDYRVLTSTPSQKQSRLQLDKRYLSIRKTIFSKSDSSTSGNEKFPNSLLDGSESKNSLPAVITSPSISPEHQRMLLLKVWLLNSLIYGCISQIDRIKTFLLLYILFF